MAISGNGWDIAPASLACQPVGGLNARDQRSSAWQQGTKDARISAKQNPRKIRVKSRVGVTGGRVDGASDQRGSSRKSAPLRTKTRRKRTGRAMAVTSATGYALNF